MNSPLRTALGAVLDAAATGDVPEADGSVSVLPGPGGTLTAAVCAFTAHHIVAADIGPDRVLAQLPAGDLSAPMGARFLAWIGDAVGAEPGALDCVLVGPSPGADIALVERADLGEHPRVRRSMRYRTDHRVFAPEDGGAVLCIGRGLAGRWEVAVEVDPRARGRGLGRLLAAAAPALVPSGQPLFAQVSPGNVASMRCFLAAGYRPIGSEVLFPV